MVRFSPHVRGGHSLHHLRFPPTIPVRPTFPLPLPAKHAREVGPSFRRVQTPTFQPKLCHYTYWYRRTWPRSSGWASGLSAINRMCTDSLQQCDIHPHHQRRNQLETFKTWECRQRGSHGCISRAYSTPRKEKSIPRVSCHGSVHPGYHGDQQQPGMSGSETMNPVCHKVN